tara:strand:+ start:1507 stop:2568 length:1062 start_codon:yes stop_codon:yes gene_type:complete
MSNKYDARNKRKILLNKYINDIISNFNSSKIDKEYNEKKFIDFFDEKSILLNEIIKNTSLEDNTFKLKINNMNIIQPESNISYITQLGKNIPRAIHSNLKKVNNKFIINDKSKYNTKLVEDNKYAEEYVKKIILSYIEQTNSNSITDEFINSFSSIISQGSFSIMSKVIQKIVSLEHFPIYSLIFSCSQDVLFLNEHIYVLGSYYLNDETYENINELTDSRYNIENLCELVGFTKSFILYIIIYQISNINIKNNTIDFIYYSNYNYNNNNFFKCLKQLLSLLDTLIDKQIKYIGDYLNFIYTINKKKLFEFHNNSYVLNQDVMDNILNDNYIELYYLYKQNKSILQNKFILVL